MNSSLLVELLVNAGIDAEPALGDRLLGVEDPRKVLRGGVQLLRHRVPQALEDFDAAFALGGRDLADSQQALHALQEGLPIAHQSLRRGDLLQEVRKVSDAPQMPLK